MKQIIIISLVCAGLASCMQTNVFEKMTVLPGQVWYYDNKPSFTFTITDTSSPYKILFVLRHTDAYQYNNIWVSFGFKAPGEAVRSQNLDITLGTDAKGWAGIGMDDIFEVTKNIRGPVLFTKPGSYTFTVSQVMRENPVKHILNVGLRIEKVRL